MKITAAKLRALDACEEYIERFEKLWPKGARVTRANVIKAVNAALPVDWLLERIWSRPAYHEYCDAARQLYGEYTRRWYEISDKYEAKRLIGGSLPAAMLCKRSAELAELRKNRRDAEAALFVRYWNRSDLRILLRGNK